MHVLTRGALLATSAALAMTLVACGSGSQEPPTTNQSLAEQAAQVNAQPYDNVRDGGTITTPIDEITPQFNQFEADFTGYTATLWAWNNPVLTTYDPKGTVAFNPDYLTDAHQDMVGPNMRVTYTINPKAVWNDGSPIDWHAFDATWRANNGSNPALLPASTDGWNRIASVTPGVNDRQAVVTYSGSYPAWPGLFSSLLNPQASNPQAFNQGYVNNPRPEWGSGPYTVEKFDQQNGTISFVRNPRWWGRRGHLDRRVFVALDSQASVNAFRNGQVDAVRTITQDKIAQVRNVPGTELRRGSITTVDLLVFNSQSPLLSDPAVRRAAMEGIDRTQLQKVEYQGLNYTEQPPGSLILYPFQDGYQDNFGKVLTFDPQKAQADLQAAGWVPGPDGIRTKNGQRLSIQYVNYSDSPTLKALASATVAMLKGIGMEMTIRQIPVTDFSKVVTQKQFDVFPEAFSANSPFGWASVCQLYCSTSTLNKSGTNAPALDPQVQAVSALPSVGQQDTQGNDIETRAFATYGVMPTSNGPAIAAFKQGIANLGPLDLYGGPGEFFQTSPENVGYQK